MRQENSLEEKVLKTIQKSNLIEEGDKIVLGVSGGPDSMCMLNALINIYKNCQKGPSLVAILKKYLTNLCQIVYNNIRYKKKSNFSPYPRKEKG